MYIVDMDGLNRTDALSCALTLSLLIAWATPAFGQASHPGDVNCDSVTTASDIITAVNYVFKSGQAPCRPSQAIVPRQTGEQYAPRLSQSANGLIDTLRISSVTTCMPLSEITLEVTLVNHDPLYTLGSPIRIESLSGTGFIRFDSLTWAGRLADSTVVDHAGWSALGVDGVTRDWAGMFIIDAVGQGPPPLAPGGGTVAELHFTVLDGPASVVVHPVNSGFVPELGYSVDFQYVADQFDLHWFAGMYIKIDADGSGDLNCDGFVTASDIIALVNLVFKS